MDEVIRVADEVIRIEDQYYILATSSLADERTQVLKHGETFAVFDRYGDIQPIGLGAQGLYYEGTRFLSRLALRVGQQRPLLLSSTVKEDNARLAVDLTNPDLTIDGQVVVPRGTVHILRTKFLWDGSCYERLQIFNYGLTAVDVPLSIQVDADFADIFEVRGMRRKRRGQLHDRVVENGRLILGYTGLDGVTRRTCLECFFKPLELSDGEIRFDVSLAPKGEITVDLVVSCESAATTAPPLTFDSAAHAAERALNLARSEDCEIYTANEQFNDWLNRALADLHMMITDTPNGPYPYAGVPWFSTAFGRDGIITALECLWINPVMARGVLAFLAATQAREVIPEQDAEPGKILHETRLGELAALGEIPFKRYYGTVDATPLFVILAAAYYERTGDSAFIESIWPNVESALQWIDQYADLDGDGFVEYYRRSPKGLVHQGWKDSKDAVFHADGSLAEGPIALCEVQGYVYAAKQLAAELAAMLGHHQRAIDLQQQAQALQERFNQVFWCEELGTYALALDGHKRPCRVRTSNAGHCLFTEIATPSLAQRTAQTLLHEDLFSGWGIRTVASSEARYNPMSYHNGSVWPHDNALVAYGFNRYGLKEAALRVMTGLFDASLFIDLHRMPELFCGFTRRPGEGPTLYPVACAPQSWAAGSIFMLLQACLGLSIRGHLAQICFAYPLLPEFLPEVHIRNLKVGTGSVDLVVQRHLQDVSINIQRREGDIEIVTIK
ncbi:MAG TPA: amylo-alpha-1,6-glucosidase [Alphaproteobacteria bacterium]|nr:amylo-alpha-1,6-glucosidase [Alphaproteobacteria bacterium]